MNKEIVVGIDVAKNFSYFVMVDPSGKKLGKAFKVLHQLDSLINAAKKLKEVEHQYDCRVVLIMESTGHYSKIPFHFFSQENFIVHMVNPIQTHSIKNLSVRKVKNDKLDAERIAILYRLGEIKPSNTFNDHEDLKFLCRQYYNLSDEITKFKNNMLSILEQMLPGYEGIFSDITSLSSMYIIEHFQTADKILKADKDELIYNLAKISRRGQSWAKDKYAQLINVAIASQKLSCTPITAEIVLKTNIAIIRELLKQQSIIRTEITLLSEQKEDISLLCSIPALGPFSAAVILSEIRDPKAFSNPRKLIAFCGIDPSVNESGKFKGTKMKISKRGSRFLRRTLYMAALACIKKKPNGQYPNATLAQYYHEKIMTKPKKSALIAVMHKLLKYIFAVLRDCKPFVEYSSEQHIINYKNSILLKAS
ncbi:IS110 family transposase [Desulfuribacillus alkaliarsenatis]|uniref:Uncharacterized protein n=1 Tax=Desulfuribacillus alkaliarsenatis TaxID=766136 RepID=A0A1E5G2L1_9FIRM|nr:IS110 family transposase [Desulfuribacillus alkaliarsenatis]OEF97219.1 hypothetical protein BHF68_14760 [Desulfuribacillus alkaliarsenatis]